MIKTPLNLACFTVNGLWPGTSALLIREIDYKIERWLLVRGENRRKPIKVE